MIGWLKGVLIEKSPPNLVVNVQGMGYELQASMNTCFQLPDAGREVELFTHFVVREDAQLLFGFYQRSERELFRQLIKVNGIGPKAGLAILSAMDPHQFQQCIRDNNLLQLKKIPGIGQKTAERLLIEMRDKLDTEAAILLPTPTSVKGYTAEAVHALIALGYKPVDASKAIARVDDGQKATAQLIKEALKGMAVC